MSQRNQESLFAPGTYDFKKVLLKDHDVDVRFKVLEINIYESIFQPCMTADITLIDADNMVANLPIIEGNVIELELACNEQDKIQQQVDGSDIRCVMEVIKITARVKTSQQDVQTYNIKCASVGWGNNVRDRVSRAFKNMTYANMVSEIFNEKFMNDKITGLSGKFPTDDYKTLDIESTQGEYSVVIPWWKPITCFNLFAGRSQSSANKDAVNYFFWECKDNFHFRSIESIMKDGPSATYYVKLQNIEKDDPKNYMNIFNYSYEDTGDVLLYGMNGTLGSRMITHDIVTKQITDHSPTGFYSLDYNVTGEGFDYTEEFTKLAHTDEDGEGLIDTDVSTTFSYDPGNTRLLVQGKHKLQYEGVKDDKCEEWLRQRIMQKPLLKYIRMTISTLGNFQRKCGEVIKIELPSPELEKGKYDARMTGNYLVTSVRRIFKPSKHEIVMEVIKDCFNKENTPSTIF